MPRLAPATRSRGFLVSLSLFVLGFASFAGAPVAAQVNQPPVITAPAEVARDPGEFFFFNVITSDPDGDQVDLEVADVPPGAVIRFDGHGNGFFQWTPTLADEGFYFLQLIATDRGTPRLRTTAEVDITIGDPNLPPRLDPIGDQQAVAGVALRVPLSASDPEGEALGFSVDPALARSVIEPGAVNGVATWVYTPGSGDVGNLEVTIVVTDGNGQDQETIVVTVGEANVPPFLEPVGDRQIEVGASLEIVLMASDADGDGLVFEAEGLPEGVLLVDDGGGDARLVGAPVGEGVFLVTVRVTDDGVPPEPAAEIFELDVRAPVPAPTPAPSVAEARWRWGKLLVSGEGVEPGAEVVLVDPRTGAVLGNAPAEASGDFSFAVRPWVPPCEVQVIVDGAAGEIVPVEGAPKRCSQAPALRVWGAFWSCRGGLKVVGGRAAPRGLVRVYDAASDELLATSRASRGLGFFLVRTDRREPPQSIRLSVEAGGVEWFHGPVEVRAKDRCNERDNDEDSDEDSDGDSDEDSDRHRKRGKSRHHHAHD